MTLNLKPLYPPLSNSLVAHLLRDEKAEGEASLSN